MINLLAKLKLRRRKKGKKEKEGVDASGHKQEVLPMAKYDLDVAHRFPRSMCDSDVREDRLVTKLY